LYYLQVLKGFIKHYGVLDRVADVDMALWSAAHLSLDPAYAPLTEEMRNDEYFQEVRVANLVKGFALFWRRSEVQRVVLARVLAEHDYVLGSVIAARVYESVLREMMEHYGMVKGDFEEINLNLVRELERRAELATLGLQPSELDALWRLRNKAVHAHSDFSVKKARIIPTRS
jgi:hypothetical protein